tara:strand:+ start:448 stop:1293 length:846 start_codon:yes stop_codon:yes gene_type:complete
MFCLEWSSTENGPKIVNLSHLKSIKSFNNEEIISNIVSNFHFTIKNQSNSFSVTLDSESVLISSLNIDSKNINKSINWYENEVFGLDFLSNYYNYYYPLICNKECLLISIPKLHKDNIINSASNNNLHLIYLSIDIFSTSTLVKQLYIKNSQKDYIIWKICNNNSHTLVVYNNDSIILYIKLKKKENEFFIDFHVGSEDYSNKIVSLLNTILIHKSNNVDMENIFIYQTKENKDTLKYIIDLKIDSIKIIDINLLIPQKSKDFYKFMPYLENGISFKGLDL